MPQPEGFGEMHSAQGLMMQLETYVHSELHIPYTVCTSLPPAAHPERLEKPHIWPPKRLRTHPRAPSCRLPASAM